LGFTVALAGKGGVGKTTIAALAILYLLRKNKKPILAVDADANSNLNELLGVEVTHTVGGARESLKTDVPSGMPKDTFMEYKIQEAVIEGEGFDLLVMGRPEGPGCYCFPNSIIKRYIEILSKNYSYLVIDNEAGMEHISRLTARDVDLLIVVSDPSTRGILTAKRIYDLVKEMEIRVGKSLLLINKVNGNLAKEIVDMVDSMGLTLGGVVPSDSDIAKFDLAQRSLLELPNGNKAYDYVSGILKDYIP